MKTTTVKQWLDTILAGKTIRQVETDTGIAKSTLSRALKSGTINTEHLVTLARTYGVNPVDVLVQIGLIKREEVQRLSGDQLLKSVPDQAFIAELLRRINDNMEHWAPLFNLESVAQNTPDQPPLNPDGTLNVTLAQKQGYALAADSSPWEPEPGDKDYNNEA